MARRKKRQEEHENHERWLVSYADFITLLFAFFVVMYAISSVNEGKYRVLSDSMEAAFKEVPRSIQPIQIGQVTKAVNSELQPIQMREQNTSRKLDKPLQPARDIVGNIEARMKRWIDQGKISVNGNDKWIDVEINTSVLFSLGSAELSLQAEHMLDELAAVLVSTANPIYVSGHSDNLPIKTNRFPSNWELSAARAVSVVRLFAAQGIEPQRMGAIGFGEHRPVSDNESQSGRMKNRRVVIRIFAAEDIFQTAQGQF